jgi:uncharacterized lipoprotein YmbA
MKRLSLILVVLLILIISVLMTGCISSVGKEYFQIYLPSTAPAGIETTRQIDKILLVEPVEVETIYNDYRIVYRTSPFHLNYYSYKYWIKKPGVLVRNCIVDYYSNKFKEVVTGFAGGEPDLQLKAVVQIIEEYDRPGAWFAHMKMDIAIIDFKTGKQLLSHSFDRESQLAGKKVEYLPAVISDILQKELDILFKKL